MNITLRRYTNGTLRTQKFSGFNQGGFKEHVEVNVAMRRKPWDEMGRPDEIVVYLEAADDVR